MDRSLRLGARLLLAVSVVSDAGAQCVTSGCYANPDHSVNPGLVAAGANCVFPFTYFGTTYNECTMDDCDDPSTTCSQGWCATEVNADGEFVWGHGPDGHGWGNCDCSTNATGLCSFGTAVPPAPPDTASPAVASSTQRSLVAAAAVALLAAWWAPLI